MKEKKDCKIVQDLLPNYIEKLTTEETNQYIEEHLKQCKDCANVLETMKKDIQLDTEKENKRGLNYFEKYNKKMTVLKAIILAIFLIFIIVVSRRALILISLSGKAEKTKNSDNYYLRYSQYEGNRMTVTEIYKKDEKQITISSHYDNGNSEHKVKWIEYYDGNIRNAYIETNGEKTALLNVEQGFPPMLAAYSYTHIENTWQVIKNSLLSSVRTATCNGKECYYFSNFQKPSRTISEVGYGVYIDKETGLPVRFPGGTYGSNEGAVDVIVECDFEHGIVTEEDVEEPDITQYRIQQ